MYYIFLKKHNLKNTETGGWKKGRMEDWKEGSTEKEHNVIKQKYILNKGIKKCISSYINN